MWGSVTSNDSSNRRPDSHRPKPPQRTQDASISELLNERHIHSMRLERTGEDRKVGGSVYVSAHIPDKNIDGLNRRNSKGRQARGRASKGKKNTTIKRPLANIPSQDGGTKRGKIS
jgi:hypothetical protein